MNRVSYKAALEIITHEAIVRQAYRDSVGVWTWSVGLTSNSGHLVERYIGKPQPMTHCLAVFVWALGRYAAEVDKAFNDRDLTEAQFAAALSFHWNTGSIGKATWVKKWLAGDVAGARKAFMQWNKPPEIVGRREQECSLFFDGEWSQTGRVIEWTRVKGNGQIDWGSGQAVNIEADLKAAMVTATQPQPDLEPPTGPPAEPGDGRPPYGWLPWFIGALVAAGGALWGLLR